MTSSATPPAFVWLNGALLTGHAARLPAQSAGTLLGWGAFTTLGVWSGRAFAVSRHLARLRADCARLELELSYSDDELRAAITQTLHENSIENGLARLTVTARGDHRWHHAGGVDVSLLVQSREKAPTSPLKLCISPFRVSPKSALSGVKSTSYGEHLAAWRQAQTRGYDDAILLTSNGCVCEASRANLFWAVNGQLYTPGKSTGCLPGIARALLLEWCAPLSIPVCEGVYSLDELLRADEVFVTASTFGARRVVAIGDTQFASGAMITRLMTRWNAAVVSEEA